jgi:hypothetical protein
MDRREQAERLGEPEDGGGEGRHGGLDRDAMMA